MILRFIGAVFFIFLVPYLLYLLASYTSVPLFAVGRFPGLAAICFTWPFDLVCWVIGGWLIAGAPLPDN